MSDPFVQWLRYNYLMIEVVGSILAEFRFRKEQECAFVVHSKRLQSICNREDGSKKPIASVALGVRMNDRSSSSSQSAHSRTLYRGGFPGANTLFKNFHFFLTGLILHTLSSFFSQRALESFTYCKISYVSAT